MKTISLNLYAFDELEPRSKEKALSDNRYVNVSAGWWDFIYDDAANIGLHITGFDMHDDHYCQADFIQHADDTAAKIISKHGSSCETYQEVQAYRAKMEELRTWMENADADQQDTEAIAYAEAMLADTLLESLENAYLTILLKEYEYRISDDAVTESIMANGYVFTADGHDAGRLMQLFQLTQ